ncbi:serine/threonine-protein kinase [Polyangium jinanense]|uniref:non-specific serine/threonine protein kinase n=1 Tax=Polyangium jinanense TaxID=2829994 RepID=A0A9X3XEG8_9BACT|nr:serine/threonine-protein kinase [Polyangium jinanense]MDC3961469.1 AAA family ATPase [Polyangium jinanense]MDC3987900.1 AAA family ATPase [Polyangium jinanense]
MPPSSRLAARLPPGVAPQIGPYLLVQQLGKGGFAPVFLAEERYDGKLLRHVAIKLFAFDAAAARGHDVSRWRDEIIEEARALCRVEHPNVVRFYALLCDDASARIGLVMEHVAGASLDMLAGAHGRLDERVVLEAARSVAWALAAVHAAGLVHRDVKPANIVRGPSGYKLIDFGIAVAPELAAATPATVAELAAADTTRAEPPPAPAAAAPRDPDTHTQTMTMTASPIAAAAPGPGARPGLRVAGTLGYLAPECLSQLPTPASDLYSLGVTMFHLVTGRLPHETPMPQGPAPSLVTSVPARSVITAELSLLVDRLLALDPLLRPRHAEWVARELERLLARLDPAVLAPVTSIAPLSVRRPAPVSTPARKAAPAPETCPPLVGRDEALATLQRAADEAKKGRCQVVVFTGPQGIGRSRLLDAAAERWTFEDARILRVHCPPEQQSPLYPFRRAVEDLPPEIAPSFEPLARALARAFSPGLVPGPDELAQAVEAIEDGLVRVSASAPLLVLVDDLQWSDTPTREVVRLLVHRAAAGAPGRLFVALAARPDPVAGAPLRKLLGEARARTSPGLTYVSLGPLEPAAAARLAQGVCPITKEVERAVVAGAAGVPFYLVHALVAWREGGAMVWQDGAYRAANEQILRGDVPGVADLLEARLGACLPPGSDSERTLLRVLAAVALAGGGLDVDLALRVAGDADRAEEALEALVGAGILTAHGERQEYGFAQEMVRQAALNLLRPRPWFHRLHRALLDGMAEGAPAELDAAFLATGYERLGALAEARVWLGRAMEKAGAAGLFEEAAAFGDRLAAITDDAETQARLAFEGVRMLIRGRKFEEAKQRLDRLPILAGDGPEARRFDLWRRVSRLEVARGLRESGVADATLVADADAFADVRLRCEARLAVAGVLLPERAMAVVTEAVDLAAGAGPAMELAARVLRSELCYALDPRDLGLAEQDLRRAVAIASSTRSAWHEVHIEGDLAVLEAEAGRIDAAIERVQRLAARANERGMRGQERLFLQNLAVMLLREGRAREAAETASRTADLARQAGDPVLRSTALSLRAAALTEVGALVDALESADEADTIQRERGTRSRALTLLRRAEILRLMGRMPEAIADARTARVVAEKHHDRSMEICAKLWEVLRLVQQGEVARTELARVVEEGRAAEMSLGALPRRLLREAEAWLTQTDEGATLL